MPSSRTTRYRFNHPPRRLSGFCRYRPAPPFVGAGSAFSAIAGSTRRSVETAPGSAESALKPPSPARQSQKPAFKPSRSAFQSQESAFKPLVSAQQSQESVFQTPEPARQSQVPAPNSQEPAPDSRNTPFNYCQLPLNFRNLRRLFCLWRPIRPP